MAPQQINPLDPLSRFLSRITYRAASQPKQTLIVAFLITCAAIAMAVTRLEFRTSRLDLLSASASYNQRWLTYLEKFGKEDDAVVIVSHPDSVQVSQALTAIGQRLQADELLRGVIFRKSFGQVAHKSLGLMKPEQLQQLDNLLDGCLKTFGGYPQGTNANAAGPGPSEFQLSLASALTQAQVGLDTLRHSIPREGPLLLEDEGRLGLCLLRVPHIDDQPLVAQSQLQAITAHIDAMRETFPDVQFGLTGMPVLEWDESRATQSDMRKATLLSLVGVAVIFVLGFGSWRMPCAAVFCLAIGLIWTVGLATLFVGHLNLFSVAFGAIIAGLGIDYSIHVLARLQTQEHDAFSDDKNRAGFDRHPLTAEDLPAALARAVAHCGKSVFIGAATTAAAFAVAVLTPFRGMTELGVICALGTLVCMTVTIWILPAVISLQALWLGEPSARGASAPMAAGLKSLNHFIMPWLQWCNASNIKWRVPVLLSTLFITVASGVQISQMKYDHNLLNLQAANAPSVQAEHELIKRSEHSAWFAVSMAKSPAHARALRERLEQLPTVARVEEIGSLIASSQQPHTVELVSACRARAAQLAEFMTTLAGHSSAGELPSVSSLQIVLPASYTSASGLAPQIASQLQLLSLTIAEMSAASVLTPEDFPETLRSRMISQDGQTYLLRVYAKQDLWQRENLGNFVKELEAVDPRITGHPIQTWYASGELEDSYYQAGIYAVIAVVALLMIDLGSLRLVALALVPVIISAVQLCGWLVAWKIPFNAANMIVLPLIIGIGIDDGVHVMHDFAQRGARAFRLSTSTTLAVLLTSLTTIVGFGSMAIADHRGLSSLGIVLMIGVGLCMWHSWFTLPALLSFLGPLKADSSKGEAIEMQPLIRTVPTSSAPSIPLLLRDVPVLLSLPDYPELRS